MISSNSEAMVTELYSSCKRWLGHSSNTELITSENVKNHQWIYPVLHLVVIKLPTFYDENLTLIEVWLGIRMLGLIT
jgi:hypothetical protein